MVKSRRLPESTAKRETLSRQRVIEAGVAYADEHGLKALSMRKLAAGLGVEAMAFYNHVANKADLLDGMVDQVLGDLPAPDTNTSWREALVTQAWSMHDILRRHPWSVPLIFTCTGGPNFLNMAEGLVGTLRRAGFSWERVDRSCYAVYSYVFGYTYWTVERPLAAGDQRVPAAAFLAVLPKDKYPALEGLASAVAQGERRDPIEFGFGLSVVLDGLEGLLDS